MNVFFRETADGRYAPRAVAGDLAPNASRLGGTFYLEHVTHGEVGANKNWSRGYYMEGAECIDSVLENIRKEAEWCDSMQGFQCVHSMGGGSGGGFGSLVLSALRDEYPDRSISTFSILPSPKVSDFVVEPYTIGFTLRKLAEFADICHVLDNGVYFDLCTAKLGLNPSLEDLNELVAQDLCGATSCLRYPDQRSGDLRKLTANLVVAPQLKFVSVSTCPAATPQSSEASMAFSIAELIRKQMQRPGSATAAARGHRALASCWSFRGNSFTARELYEVSPPLFQFQPLEVAGSTLEKVTANVCLISSTRQTTTCTVVRNSTHLVEALSSVVERYEHMWRRKAFISWYTECQYQDECEFQDVLEALQELIGAYKDQMTVL
jgi:tubulin beta